MSNFISRKPKPQVPQESQPAPDGKAVASLILGILGITVFPFIGGILAVILGGQSIGDAYKRGERGSTTATAGVILGWIGVAAPAIFFVLWFFEGGPLIIVGILLSLMILGLSALAMYYTVRNNRR